MFARFGRTVFGSPFGNPPPAGANQNQRLRPTGDSYVRIDGVDYPIRSWGPDGFQAVPYTGSLIPGQRATVQIVIRDLVDRCGTLRFDATVKVSQIDQFGLHARWSGLPTYKSRMIQEYLDRKLAERSQPR